jgi:hypothetical protein
MTQDEIIEIAQKCNLIGMRPHLDGIYTEALTEFAKLVAAKEREACAKVCEDDINSFNGAYYLANKIRARIGDKA